MRLSAALVMLLAAAACKADDAVDHLPDASHGSGSGMGSDGGGSGSGIDAPTGDTSCAAAVPTTAPDSVTLSGTITDDDATFGTAAAGLADATLDAYRTGSATSLGETTTEQTGIFQLTAATGLHPVDYMAMTETGYTPTRYYPKAPAASAKAFSKLPLLTTASTAALPGMLGATQTAGDGIVVVYAVTCDSLRIGGATVAISPAGTSTVKYLGGGTATDTSGVAVIFNVPPGAATVSVTASGVDLRPVPVAADPTYTTMVTVSEK